MITDAERRIARNAVFLYVRMFITVIVTLYASRVVLETLGEKDYGIYGLVGGIVAIFAFLNDAMSAATMRFLNYEMGVGDAVRLKKTLGTAVLIHVVIAAIVLLLSETVGLWYVNTHLVIAPERMVAANWVYQFSIAGCIVMILQIPFSAAIMAHENMDTYAYIMLAYTFLKLGAALFILWIVTPDNLVTYAALFSLATLVTGVAYFIYCRKHYVECRGAFHGDRSIAKTMVSYTSWGFYANMSHTTRLQGTNILLNNFGGTVLNAAASLAVTVSSTLANFSASIVSAFRPQVVKQYAAGNIASMLKLHCNAARYSMLLLMMLAVPVFIEMPYVLQIWLKDVPAYTVVFCRLCIIAMAGELLKLIVDMGVQATGRVAWLSFISGTLLLVELPMMYVLLRYTGQPQVVYVVHCIWIMVVILADSIILKIHIPEFSILRYIYNGFLLPLSVAAIASLASAWIMTVMDEGLVRLVAICSATVVIFALLTFAYCLDDSTRQEVVKLIANKLKRH